MLTLTCMTSEAEPRDSISCWQTLGRGKTPPVTSSDDETGKKEANSFHSSRLEHAAQALYFRLAATSGISMSSVSVRLSTTPKAMREVFGPGVSSFRG